MLLSLYPSQSSPSASQTFALGFRLIYRRLFSLLWDQCLIHRVAAWGLQICSAHKLLPVNRFLDLSLLVSAGWWPRSRRRCQPRPGGCGCLSTTGFIPVLPFKPMASGRVLLGMIHMHLIKVTEWLRILLLRTICPVLQLISETHMMITELLLQKLVRTHQMSTKHEAHARSVAL